MEAGDQRANSRILAEKLLAHHRPTGVEVDLVVFVLPLCTAAFTAVLGDGDLTVVAGFFAVDALHQSACPGAPRQLRWMPAHESHNAVFFGSFG